MLGGVVSDILEHADGDQVVIDVTATVTCVHVNCIEHGDEVLLAQPVDVVADYQLEAAEATCHDLFTFVLQRLADSHDDNAPALVLDLLPTSLDNLLEALEDSQLV